MKNVSMQLESGTLVPPVQQSTAGNAIDRRIEPRKRLLTLLAMVVLAAGFIQLRATRFGIGLSPDSVKYVRYARTILGTEQPPAPGVIRDFLTHYPPLYPAMLALFTRVGLDIYGACRAIQVLLLAANMLLVARVVFVLTGRRLGIAVMAAAAFPLICPISWVHLWGWSEPLFIFLSLAALSAFASIGKQPVVKWVVAAAVFSSLAAVTRYAGVALIPCGILTIGLACYRSSLQAQSARWGRALWLTGLFGVVSLMPLAGVLWHNHRLAGKATNRQFGYTPGLLKRLHEGADCLAGWVWPVSIGSGWDLYIGISVLVLIMASLVWAWRVTRRRGTHPIDLTTAAADLAARGWLITSILFICCYLGLLMFSIAFLDPLTPLDDRILSPIAAVLIVSWAIAVNSWWIKRAAALRTGGWTARVGGRMIFAAAGLICVLMIVPTAANVRQGYQFGYGFRHEWWRETGVARVVSLIGRNKRIYTNDPDAIYALTGRSAAGLTAKSRTRVSNDADLAKRLEYERLSIAARGCVVFFKKKASVNSEKQDLSLRKFQKAMNLEVVREFSHGVVLNTIRTKTTRPATTAKSDGLPPTTAPALRPKKRT